MSLDEQTLRNIDAALKDMDYQIPHLTVERRAELSDPPYLLRCIRDTNDTGAVVGEYVIGCRGYSASYYNYICTLKQANDRLQDILTMDMIGNRNRRSLEIEPTTTKLSDFCPHGWFCPHHQVIGPGTCNPTTTFTFPDMDLSKCKLSDVHHTHTPEEPESPSWDVGNEVPPADTTCFVVVDDRYYRVKIVGHFHPSGEDKPHALFRSFYSVQNFTCFHEPSLFVEATPARNYAYDLCAELGDSKLVEKVETIAKFIQSRIIDGDVTDEADASSN